ncbi:MAG: UvrD-helicase domain-containing protein [Candidatus Pacebacteria bacterium]|nr:UvrD-helicase domain-containing protein [Candidatus Paceibacterota bacterium]
MQHLAGLNNAQKEAVLATEGPVLVLAGAGAGKTKTIAHRIVHIVKGGTPAYRILAITFTNKAAREMRERVLGLLHDHEADDTGTPTVSTFHALCATLLREHAEAAGLPKHFTIFDRADSIRVIKRALKETVGDDARFEPRAVLSAISRAKGDALSRSVYQERAGRAWFPGAVAQVWQVYDRALRAEGAVDFDDLLFLVLRLLSTNVEVCAALAKRYRYIHVDEYQDTNKVQYEIVRKLAGEHENIFCVGDLDQNVYSFRGASIDNILDFERSFPKATLIRLEQNYRSTNTIVTVSNKIIEKNKRRKKKTLFTENVEGEKMSLSIGYDERDEALRVAEAARDCTKNGISPREIAVLYRANFQSRALEEAFLAIGVPYRVLGTRFFDRKEIKDVLSYVRASLNRDSWADIGRIINEPARGIGKVSFDKLVGGNRALLTGKIRDKVDDFFVILDAIGSFSLTHLASETLVYVLERSSMAAALDTKRDEDLERLENVRELVSLATNRYDALPAPDGLLRLLEDAALATDQDELDQRTDRTTNDAVTLMTVHASKGLEFRHVFITGLEEGLFPHRRFNESAAKDDEEERRLFYVALTRAKEKVHLSYALVRTVFGQRNATMPSEFVLDIDEEYIESSTETERKERVVYLD